MQFEAGVESHFYGKAKWVQILDSFEATGLGLLDGLPVINPNVSGVLDNQDPYMGERDVLANAAASESRVPLIDGPSALAYWGSIGSIKLEAVFSDYLMFKPSTAGSIYVPLGNTHWDATGIAEEPSREISPNSVNGPDDLNESIHFPEWESVFSN